MFKLQLRLSFIFYFCVLSWSIAAAVTSEEQSERLQLIHGHLLDYRWAQAPETFETSQWALIGEVLWMPNVDNTVGTKEEPIESPPLIPRPRGQFLHSSGWFIGGSWLPPLEVQGFKANLFNLESGYIKKIDQIHIGGRGAFSVGGITGPITDPDLKDRFRLTRYNVDLALSYEIKSFLVFGGGGAGIVTSSLEIEADGVTLDLNNHNYLYGFAGVTYRWNEHLRFSFQQQQSESFLSHWTASASFQF